MDPVAKKLQRDARDARESGTVTGKTCTDVRRKCRCGLGPLDVWTPQELNYLAKGKTVWATMCYIFYQCCLFDLSYFFFIFRECQVTHWPKHKKACQLMAEATEMVQRSLHINS